MTQASTISTYVRDDLAILQVTSKGLASLLVLYSEVVPVEISMMGKLDLLLIVLHCLMLSDYQHPRPSQIIAERPCWFAR